MNIIRIKETCIYVTNLQATKSFYADKLGFPVLSLVAGKHVFFRVGVSVLLCFIAAQSEKQKLLPPHGASGSIHFAFEVSKKDYDNTLKWVKDQNIVILNEHTWPVGLRSFYFHDPDNNLVEIIEEGLWEQAYE